MRTARRLPTIEYFFIDLPPVAALPQCEVYAGTKASAEGFARDGSDARRRSMLDACDGKGVADGQSTMVRRERMCVCVCVRKPPCTEFLVSMSRLRPPVLSARVEASVLTAYAYRGPPQRFFLRCRASRTAWPGNDPHPRGGSRCRSGVRVPGAKPAGAGGPPRATSRSMPRAAWATPCARTAVLPGSTAPETGARRASGGRRTRRLLSPRSFRCGGNPCGSAMMDCSDNP